MENNELDVQAEKRRVTRYIISRVAGRIWDVAVYSIVLSTYGVASFPYAWALASSVSYPADFFLQKFWTFGLPVVWTRKLFKEFFSWYLLIRGGTVLAAFGAAHTLTEVHGFPTWKAAAIIVPVFLITRYLLFRWYFFGRVSDLWVALKKLTQKVVSIKV